MDFIKEWFTDLQNITGTTWKETITVEGKCSKHTGPSIWFASVILDFSPSSQFIIDDTLSPDLSELIRDRNWYQYIAFGVLDVMLTMPTRPIRNFTVTISHIDFNEVESNPMAFRLAARNAASKALKKHFPSMNLVTD